MTVGALLPHHGDCVHMPVMRHLLTKDRQEEKLLLICVRKGREGGSKRAEGRANLYLACQNFLKFHVPHNTKKQIISPLFLEKKKCVRSKSFAPSHSNSTGMI